MVRWYAFIGLFLLVGARADYTPAALRDKVAALPGAEALNLTFNQFSGYLLVDGAQPGSIAVHYWFVESTRDPATDPLILWTNGGPGCSGLLGLLFELGPFFPNPDLSLSPNPYSWNQLANILFIESPCGVGFSYSNISEDYTASDNSTAMINYQIIKAFLSRFPALSSSELYLASESYGGHYIPTLAALIVELNQQYTQPINFKVWRRNCIFALIFLTSFSGIFGREPLH